MSYARIAQCPFCGSSNVRCLAMGDASDPCDKWLAGVSCQHCGAEGPSGLGYQKTKRAAKARAIEAWNIRVEPRERSTGGGT